MPLWLCVSIAHYTTVIMLEARSKRGKGGGGWLYFQVTGYWYVANWISIPIQVSSEGWLVLSWLVNVGWLVILASY